MKASEAIVILEALNHNTEVTLIINRNQKLSMGEPPAQYRSFPPYVVPMVDTTWPHYPNYTVTCKNVH